MKDMTNLAAIAALTLLTACSGGLYAPRGPAPPIPPGPPLPVEDLRATLARGVDEDAGTVDYSALRADRAALDRHVALVAVAGPQSTPALFPTPEHAKAYHLNAYNELVLHGVLSEDEDLTSVLDIGVMHAFFRRKRFRLDRRDVTLSTLENDIIRPTYKDARIHFAINCASASCPALGARPFVAAGLDDRLGEATRRFLARDDAVAIDVPGKRVTLSKLFDWYRSDFADWPLRSGAPAPGSAVAFVAAHVSDDRRGQLEAACGAAFDRCAVEHFDYDWSLNDRR